MHSKAARPALDLVVVGSVGLDTIATPAERRRDVLGGSASYACAAAARMARVGMVGVVGRDFPARAVARFRALGIDLQGVQRAEGRTFRWSGVYARDMNRRRTLETALNVFADFAPELPPAYRAAPFLFLANIAPALQLRVLDQVRAPRFVAADTMDLWIRTARPALRRVIGRIDLLLVNDAELRQLTHAPALIEGARRLLDWGPRGVVVKKGEHGCALVTRRTVVLLPAFPVAAVRDPTGAGDAFAGGFMGWLARAGGSAPDAVRRALLYGTVAASFAVESFGLDRLCEIRRRDLAARARRLLGMVRV